MSAEFLDFSDGSGPERVPEGSRGLLTPRQHQVLAYLAKGFTNSEIGDILQCSEGTVKNHVAAILSRLEVSNRTEAASEWVRRNGRFADAREMPAVAIEATSAACTELAMMLRGALIADGFRIAAAGERGTRDARVLLIRREDRTYALVEVTGHGLAVAIESDAKDPENLRQTVRAVVALIGTGLA
ncbi:response regulator transcription factor [Litorisediminicola beolgyonensis]|uniref:Response regulator transcription factor n=1 Tax=Litorisediminicola beolgyonensis TaxID=1173614 RepID=A0ABW3ZJF8_9RHOB